MPEVWLAVLAVCGGVAGLVWSADRFVAGSAAIALHLGLSKLVIGLTIVSLGTSAPELMVAASSALKGAGEIGVGNALGSNLANIGLVLGATALVAPLPAQPHLLRHEVPTLLVVTGLAGLALADGRLSQVEGLVLLALVPPLLWLTVRYKKRYDGVEEEDVEIQQYTMARAFAWFALGLAALLASSEILVWGARHLALAAGVSPLVIGLTVVALGTSLPELAASLASVLRGHFDLALGNIIGSNILNLLAVMALPGAIASIQMEIEVFSRDYLAMLAITLLLVTAVSSSLWYNPGQARLGRPLGILLLASYIGYYWLLFRG
ncbi:calcium/sodium antiporter [Microbulbifer yueqingensis]|uniref:Cation:H+ antiporter n=1 Tax=Microbulbifer yueqingensis TaxID=658219 RepID=A0A1G8VHD7_9GAMM|nr:calcium/sodium antiporter [Microbulbifer yueqingensis]SDJ65536.1 cation:H+ antiporter [Microbulbifer yueqingensis]